MTLYRRTISILFTHIYDHVSTWRICGYMYVNAAAPAVARKTRVSQHLPDWANWFVLYLSWICYRDCSKLPSSSRLHCALQQTHTNASTHGCTGCLKIDEYYFSYKFQSDFSLADNNTIFYITYDIYWCVLCYFTSYNNMHLHIFIYFYIIIYFIILYIINYKSILSYITLYIVHNIIKQD